MLFTRPYTVCRNYLYKQQQDHSRTTRFQCDVIVTFALSRLPTHSPPYREATSLLRYPFLQPAPAPSHTRIQTTTQPNRVPAMSSAQAPTSSTAGDAVPPSVVADHPYPNVPETTAGQQGEWGRTMRGDWLEVKS